MPKKQGAGKKKPTKAADKKPGGDATPLRTFERHHKKQITALAFAPDGQTLASGSADTTVRLWDTASGKPCECGVLKAEWGITEVAFSPDGRKVAVVSRGVNDPVQGHTKAFLWDLIKRDDPELEKGHGHKFQFCSPTFAPSDRVAFKYEGVCQYSTIKGERLSSFPAGPKGDRIAFSPDGRWIVFGEWEGPLYVFDAHTLKKVRTLEGHTDYITQLAFSTDGKWLASASSSYGQAWTPRDEDYSIRLWEFEDGHERRCWTSTWETTIYLAFLADGQRLISFHDPHGDACLHLWSPDASEPLASWSPTIVTAVAVWSTLQGRKVGGRIATGHRDGSIKLWDLADVLAAPGIAPFDTCPPPAEHAPAKKQAPSPASKKKRGSGKALLDESE